MLCSNRFAPLIKQCNYRSLSFVSLPPLPYEYNALEPVISGEIMQEHYEKHHRTYVNNYNKAVEEFNHAEQKNQLEKAIALQNVLKFNGGGHVNHSIFWSILQSPSTQDEGEKPKSELYTRDPAGNLIIRQPSDELMDAIKNSFGSFEKFQDVFTKKTAAIQGSGWGWLGYCRKMKTLHCATTSNQDPLSTLNLIPIMGIDVWEHAYYLQYKSQRVKYLNEMWKILNWKEIAKRFDDASKEIKV